MAFVRKNDIQPFDKKIWLASPAMHSEELMFVTEAYETNWMSTVGQNINEVERIAAERAGAYIARVALREGSRHPLYAIRFDYKFFTFLAKILPARFLNWLIFLLYGR